MSSKHVLKGFEIDTTELIGQGANGQVFLCKKLDEPNLKLCAKVINSCHIDLVEDEISVLKKLSDAPRDCPNVVKTYLAEYAQELDKIVIIMEKCETDLEKAIKLKKYFAESEALQIFKQIVLGYKFIYENNIIHRDLRPANILIQSNLYKIANFGEGKIIDRSQANKLTKRGSPVYQAPELFQSDQNQIIATEKVDVFSLGILFFEILYGQLPQGNRTQIKMSTLVSFVKALGEGVKITFPQEPKVSDITKQLIEKMLIYNPDNRIGWEEIFKHLYFQIAVKRPIIQPNQKIINNRPLPQPQPQPQPLPQPQPQPQPPRFTTSLINPNQSHEQLQQSQIIGPNNQIQTILPPKIIQNIQPNLQMDQSNKQLLRIFAWIIEMQRIIEEKCNELLRGPSDQEIINNLKKSLGNIYYYYNITNANDEVKSISSQIYKDNQIPINFQQNAYNNLSKHLQILQYHIVIDSNKKYSPDYHLFHRFLTNLSQKKYNFENPQMLSSQLEQDHSQCGRKSQQ